MHPTQKPVSSIFYISPGLSGKTVLCIMIVFELSDREKGESRIGVMYRCARV